MTNKSTWTVVYSKAALKDMKSLDHAIQKRVHVFLTDKEVLGLVVHVVHRKNVYDIH